MAFDSAIATMTIFCEASGEPYAAKRGVAHTILNRLSLDPARYGSTIAAVCLKRMQFSEWNADRIDNRNLLRAAETSDDDASMQECHAALMDAMSGGSDPTLGATHYFDDSIQPPSWTREAQRVGKIGRLIFYRNVP